MHRLALLASLVLLASACSSEPAAPEEPQPEAEEAEAATEVEAEAPSSSNLQLADIPFAAFDPEKPEGIHVYPISGDPRAGAFNAIVRMPAGFATPLHTHEAAFSGVTLTEGLVHSATTEDDQPLPKGSFWHQPAGEAHIDACKSEDPCLMLAFFEGAVDMTPAEAPAAEPTMTVTRADAIEWTEVKGGVQMAVIHGNPKEGAFHALFDFPAGMATNVHTHSAAFTGALISGTHHRGPSAEQLVTLTDGAVWNEVAGTPHMEQCGTESNCVVAAAMDGALDTEAVELTQTGE